MSSGRGPRRTEFNHYAPNSWRPSHGEHYSRPYMQERRRWKSQNPETKKTQRFASFKNDSRSNFKRMEYNRKRRSRLERRFAEMDNEIDPEDPGPPLSDTWNPEEETNQFDGIPEMNSNFSGPPQRGFFPDKNEKKYYLRHWMNADMENPEKFPKNSKPFSSKNFSEEWNPSRKNNQSNGNYKLDGSSKIDGKKTNGKFQNGHSSNKKGIGKEVDQSTTKNSNGVPEYEIIRISDDDGNDDVHILDDSRDNGNTAGGCDPGLSTSERWWDEIRVQDNRITWKKTDVQPMVKNNYEQ
ncbi:hypothetical protein FO519_004946 [Halicephalobus sp. NKZ332]|nr:hypothetical protein FO519_004946 [Halicephalobus sp. NKZ332]